MGVVCVFSPRILQNDRNSKLLENGSKERRDKDRINPCLGIQELALSYFCCDKLAGMHIQTHTRTHTHKQNTSTCMHARTRMHTQKDTHTHMHVESE